MANDQHVSSFSYSKTFNVYDLPSVSIPAGRSPEVCRLECRCRTPGVLNNRAGSRRDRGTVVRQTLVYLSFQYWQGAFHKLKFVGHVRDPI